MEKNPAYPAAIHALQQEGMLPWRVRLRQCKFLNNVIEQDHRLIKSRVRPMLGFKSFYNARRVLIGIELLKKLYKGQYRVPNSFGSNLHFVWRNVLAS